MATKKKSTAKILGTSMGWGIAALVEGSKNQYQLVEAFASRDQVRAARQGEYNAPNFKVVRIRATFTGYNK